MKNKKNTLEQQLNTKLNRATVGLIVITLIINLMALIYDVNSLSNNVYYIFTNQMNNVARVSSQNGDLLSLQRSLESVFLPLTVTFPVSVKIIRINDHKAIVDLGYSQNGGFKIFQRAVTSILKVYPFGDLEMNLVFDISNIFFLAIFKALITCSLIVGALFIMRHYIRLEGRRSLYPIDEFSAWLDKVGPDEFAKKDAALPIGGLTDELKFGFQKLFKKLHEMSLDVAQLESERRVGEIARRVAHDIRSPLSVLNIFFKTVSGISEENKNTLMQVSSRINGIAEELLSISNQYRKFDGNNLVLSSTSQETVILKSLIERIFKEKTIEYKNHPKVNLALRIENIDDLVRVKFSENELFRILSNLINNSIEAIVDNGEIFIQSYIHNNKAVIVIIDSGVGIPEDIQRKIFSTGISTKAQGSGIGLSSAIKVVKEYGGEISILSKENIGTQVSIFLNRV